MNAPSTPQGSEGRDCLTFWFSGGDIIFGSHPRTFLTDGDVRGLLDIYQDEVTAALRIGDREASRHPRKMFLQLTDAQFAQARWRQLFRAKA